MKLGVSSYSFNGDLKSGKYELTDLPALAKKIGFDEIEFVPFGPLSDPGTAPDYAKKLKAACKECGIDMGNYTVAGDFLSGSGGDLEGEVERLKGEVLVAQILGSPGMRHDAAWGLPADMPHYTGFDDVLPTPGRRMPESNRVCPWSGYQNNGGKSRLFCPGLGPG
jgi:sugar phosphate isomerase/epimerase